jgi:hypothetical protein
MIRFRKDTPRYWFICSGRMVIAEVKGRRIMLHWRLRCSRFLETALKSIRT